MVIEGHPIHRHRVLKESVQVKTLHIKSDPSERHHFVNVLAPEPQKIADGRRGRGGSPCGPPDCCHRPGNMGAGLRGSAHADSTSCNQ